LNLSIEIKKVLPSATYRPLDLCGRVTVDRVGTRVSYVGQGYCRKEPGCHPSGSLRCRTIYLTAAHITAAANHHATPGLIKYKNIKILKYKYR